MTIHRNTKPDCNCPHRSHDIARECQCDGCKRWWVDNTKGYFLCPSCNMVCLTMAELCGTICETCVDELDDDDYEGLRI